MLDRPTEDVTLDEAFAASYETALITKPTEQALRKLLLSSELVTASKSDGTVKFAGNRYWGEFLLEQRGRKVTLRFDPEALHQPIHVYAPTGAYLGRADCTEAAGFFDTDAARAHARVRGDFVKATKAAALAAQKLTLAEQAALLPAPEESDSPAPRVQRPMIVKGSNARKPIANDAVEADEDPFFAAFNRLAARLRVVRNEDGAGD